MRWLVHFALEAPVLLMDERGLKINYGQDGTLDCPPDDIISARVQIMRLEHDES